jgi:hypothetical protein
VAINNSKGGGIAKGALGGFMAGGPVGAIVGAVGGALPSSPGKSLLELGKGVSDLSDKFGSQQSLAIGQPQTIGNDIYDPMKNRLQQLGTDPMNATNQALAAMRDPSVPDYMRSAYAEPLLRYKYFGKGGGIA